MAPVTERLRKRVRAGMAFLDVTNPRWRRSINLDKLDLSDGECCVLGEVYGDYSDGRNALFRDVSELSNDYGATIETESQRRNKMAETFGFWLDDAETPHYRRLTEIWKEEYRRGQAQARREAAAKAARA